MKNRVKNLLTRMNECQTFQDFQNIYKTSKLHTGIDDIPLTNDNKSTNGKGFMVGDYEQ